MLSRWQSTIVDAQGNVQPGAVLTIRHESDQSLAQVYMSPSDQQPYPLGQVPADSSGFAYFYAPGGLYRIQSVALGIDWRHVPLGDLQGMDKADLGLGTAATRDVGTGANEVPANSNLGAAAYLPIATTSQAQELTNDATVITPKKLGDSLNANVAMLAGGAAANFANMIRVSGKDVIATGSNANGFWMEFSIGIIFQMSIGFQLTYQDSSLLIGQWAFPRQATGEFGIFYSAADSTTKGTNSSVLSPVSTNATTNAGAQVVVRSQGASNRFSSEEKLGVTCLFVGVV